MVPTPTLTYPIYIGERLQDAYKDFFKKYPRIGLVTNDTLFDLYKTLILDLRAEVPQVFFIIVNDGERYKNIHVLSQVFQQFASENLDRDGLIAAFGGGVIGDQVEAWFCGACERRRLHTDPDYAPCYG